MSVKCFAQFLIERAEIDEGHLHEALDLMESKNKTLGEQRLRVFRSSSSMLSVELKRELEEFYRVPYTEGLGSTEGGPITDVGLPPVPRKEGSLGRLAHDGIRFVDNRRRFVQQIKYAGSAGGCLLKILGHVGQTKKWQKNLTYITMKTSVHQGIHFKGQSTKIKME